MNLAAENPLPQWSQLQWKHRVVLHNVPEGEPLERMLQHLKAHAAGVEERDLVLVSLRQEARLPWHVSLPGAEREALTRRHGFQDGEIRFVLIGKDGGAKHEQAGILNLEEIFAIIDAMPMRQREMRNAAQESVGTR